VQETGRELRDGPEEGKRECGRRLGYVGKKNDGCKTQKPCKMQNNSIT
jgi:hypothetical protein